MGYWYGAATVLCMRKYLFIYNDYHAPFSPKVAHIITEEEMNKSFISLGTFSDFCIYGSDVKMHDGQGS